MTTSDPLWLSKICVEDSFWHYHDSSFGARLHELDLNATPISSPKAPIDCVNELFSEPGTDIPASIEGNEDLKCVVTNALLRARPSIRLTLDEALFEVLSAGTSSTDVVNEVISRIESHILSEIPQARRLGSPRRTIDSTSFSQTREQTRNVHPDDEVDDTDASWAGNEIALETYSRMIDDRLEDCLYDSLLLPNLNRCQRRTLRAQAHMKRLNHVSFGKGKSRCLFISRYMITAGAKIPQSGSYFMNTERPVVCILTKISPMVVQESENRPRSAIDWIQSDYDLNNSVEFRSALQENGLVGPATERWPTVTFEKASDVARICSVLHDRTIDHYGVENQRPWKWKICVRPNWLDTGDLDEPFPIFAKGESRSQWHASSQEVNAIAGGSGDETSTIRFEVDFCNGLEGTPDICRRKRQRRMPKKEGGFTCRHPTCTKSFDFSGNRTKHEASHDWNKRRHECEQCGKRFMYPKDLRRHLEIHYRGDGISATSDGSRPPSELPSQFDSQPRDLYPTPSSLEGLSQTLSMADPVWAVDEALTPVSVRISMPYDIAGKELCI